MRMLSLPLHIIFWDLSDPRLRKVRRGAWCLLLLPSWKQKVFLKHCCCSTRLHGVILLTPSDPARWRKFPCMIHHTQSTVKVCVCHVMLRCMSPVNWNWMSVSIQLSSWILTDKQCTRLHTNSAGPQPQHLWHNTTCVSETTYI